MANPSGLSKIRFVALSFNVSTGSGGPILLCIVSVKKKIPFNFFLTAFLVYIALGLLLSLQPPFYPSEAEKKGAKPAEYGFVFGIANLSLFVFRQVFVFIHTTYYILLLYCSKSMP